MTYEEDHRRIGEQIDQLAAKRAYAPHCDSQVLHAPGTCWSCDGYPDWQSARLTWQINFTGENSREKLPCPAELRRPVDQINLWRGNRAEGRQTFDTYLTDMRERAKEFGATRFAFVSSETRLQRLRRRLADFFHYHF